MSVARCSSTAKKYRNSKQPPLSTKDASTLLQRDREAAEVDIRQQPDLPPRQLQHGALLVGEHNRACAGGRSRETVLEALKCGEALGTAMLERATQLSGSSCLASGIVARMQAFNSSQACGS